MKILIIEFLTLSGPGEWGGGAGGRTKMLVAYNSKTIHGVEMKFVG